MNSHLVVVACLPQSIISDGKQERDCGGGQTLYWHGRLVYYSQAAVSVADAARLEPRLQRGINLSSHCNILACSSWPHSRHSHFLGRRRLLFQAPRSLPNSGYSRPRRTLHHSRNGQHGTPQRSWATRTWKIKAIMFFFCTFGSASSDEQHQTGKNRLSGENQQGKQGSATLSGASLSRSLAL